MLHYDPQHVSSSTLLILRRTNCITTASGIVTLCKQPYSMQVESGLTESGCSTLLILRRTNCITTASGIVTLHKQPYSTAVRTAVRSQPAYCTAVYRR